MFYYYPGNFSGRCTQVIKRIISIHYSGENGRYINIEEKDLRGNVMSGGTTGATDIGSSYSMDASGLNTNNDGYLTIDELNAGDVFSTPSSYGSSGDDSGVSSSVSSDYSYLSGIGQDVTLTGIADGVTVINLTDAELSEYTGLQNIPEDERTEDQVTRLATLQTQVDNDSTDINIDVDLFGARRDRLDALGYDSSTDGTPQEFINTGLSAAIASLPDSFTGLGEAETTELASLTSTYNAHNTWDSNHTTDPKTGAHTPPEPASLTDAQETRRTNLQNSADTSARVWPQITAGGYVHEGTGEDDDITWEGMDNLIALVERANNGDDVSEELGEQVQALGGLLTELNTSADMSAGGVGDTLADVIDYVGLAVSGATEDQWINDLLLGDIKADLRSDRPTIFEELYAEDLSYEE
jgi:hypothetical protein